MTEPVIAVGILTSSLVRFSLEGTYAFGIKREALTGALEAHAASGKVVLNQGGREIVEEDGLLIEPQGSGPNAIRLHDVTIGVQFHWERKEQQWFTGSIRFIVSGNQLIAVNVVSVEDYLTSVISSEMSAASSLPLLKAHAITSRSWLLAQLEKTRALKVSGGSRASSLHEDQGKHIRWYDREDHALFDVCADDHCQRYQGMTRGTSSAVAEAMRATRGMVLLYNGQICDARFSKACGGVTETFENVWEPVEHPYLAAVADSGDAAHGDLPQLVSNAEAEDWIRSSPPAFCNTDDPAILSQVLVQFDRETTDFYRWKVEYGQRELAELVRSKSGVDFGEIVDFIPVLRGTSGRIIELKIVGTKREMIIGKELEIRKFLSPTHLYSSAFVVDAVDRRNSIPGRFTLTGAGWGHGVGLCQIGAAVMGAKGYSHEQILRHYFSGVEIKNLY